jgi:hypothetical protein
MSRHDASRCLIVSRVAVYIGGQIKPLLHCLDVDMATIRLAAVWRTRSAFENVVAEILRSRESPLPQDLRDLRQPAEVYRDRYHRDLVRSQPES